MFSAWIVASPMAKRHRDRKHSVIKKCCMDRSDRAIIAQAQDEYQVLNAGVPGAVEMVNADDVGGNLIGLALIKYRGAYQGRPSTLSFYFNFQRTAFSGKPISSFQLSTYF